MQNFVVSDIQEGPRSWPAIWTKFCVFWAQSFVRTKLCGHPDEQALFMFVRRVFLRRPREFLGPPETRGRPDEVWDVRTKMCSSGRSPGASGRGPGRPDENVDVRTSVCRGLLFAETVP